MPTISDSIRATLYADILQAPIAPFRWQPEILYLYLYYIWKSPDYVKYHICEPGFCAAPVLNFTFVALIHNHQLVYKHTYDIQVSISRCPCFHRQCLEHLSHNVTHTHTALLKRPFTPPLPDTPLFWCVANCLIILMMLRSIISISSGIVIFLICSYR